MFCTPDLLTNQGVVEIETSWDATTFPFFEDEVHKLVKKEQKTGGKIGWLMGQLMGQLKGSYSTPNAKEKKEKERKEKERKVKDNTNTKCLFIFFDDEMGNNFQLSTLN